MMQAGNLLGGSVNQGQYSELIKKYSKALGVDPSLVSAMIEAESSQRQYNKDGSIYTSSAGAAGMAQIMPGTAEGIVQNYQKDLQKVLGMRVTKQLVLNDPNANLAAGILHLGVLIQTVKNAYPHIGLEEQYKLALAAYNAGYGAVKKYKGVPPYKQTQDYVAKILKNYRILKGR
jgi:soluble lytic murein transglycosylase-like protein